MTLTPTTTTTLVADITLATATTAVTEAPRQPTAMWIGTGRTTETVTDVATRAETGDSLTGTADRTEETGKGEEQMKTLYAIYTAQ